MRICLVSSGLEEANRRLQPWHYLFEMAQALAQDGHQVVLISDGSGSADPQGIVAGLPVLRLASLGRWPEHGSPAAIRAVKDLAPDTVLWHLGLTSFTHLPPLQAVPCPVIGVFTSPVYRPRELLRLGIGRLLCEPRLSGGHLLGLLVPGGMLRRPFDQSWMQGLVVECETTYWRLIKRGIPAHRIQVRRPGIDPIWLQAVPAAAERAQSRQEMGLPPRDFVVGYFGPPAILRGLRTLLRALALLQQTQPSTRALVLSRERDGQPRLEQHWMEDAVGQLGIRHRMHLVSGSLAQADLRHALAACDVVALPFEIVPSDVPLSVLEAMALGLPLVTSDVACLPELVSGGAGLVIAPGEPELWAGAIHALAQDPALRERLAVAGRRRAMAWQSMRDTEPGWTRLLNLDLRR